MRISEQYPYCTVHFLLKHEKIHTASSGNLVWAEISGLTVVRLVICLKKPVDNVTRPDTDFLGRRNRAVEV